MAPGRTHNSGALVLKDNQGTPKAESSQISDGSLPRSWSFLAACIEGCHNSKPLKFRVDRSFAICGFLRSKKPGIKRLKTQGSQDCIVKGAGFWASQLHVVPTADSPTRATYLCRTKKKPQCLSLLQELLYESHEPIYVQPQQKFINPAIVQRSLMNPSKHP